MRINIYAEELTNETRIITKEVDGKVFHGVRLYLHSPTSLHNTATDDDRSAITFWVPYRSGRNHPEELVDIFGKLLNEATGVFLKQ